MLKYSDNFIGSKRTRYDPNQDNLAFLGIERCKNCLNPMMNKKDPRHKFCCFDCMQEYDIKH